ncbi:MAG: hypothetical protein AB2L14_02045 [Candidatus Xenobiia bacterium LiM19]
MDEPSWDFAAPDEDEEVSGECGAAEGVGAVPGRDGAFTEDIGAITGRDGAFTEEGAVPGRDGAFAEEGAMPGRDGAFAEEGAMSGKGLEEAIRFSVVPD